jgi:hypothetical protein
MAPCGIPLYKTPNGSALTRNDVSCVRAQVLSGPSMPKERTTAAAPDTPMTNWLLAVLCYAVTREEADRSAVLVLAKAMDRSGPSRAQPSSFEFFRRSSLELCGAIADDTGPRRADIIRGYLKQIDNQRLRRAIEAAAELPNEARLQKTGARTRPNDRQRALWKGLT